MTSPRAVAMLALSLFVLVLSVGMAILGTDRDELFTNPGRPAQAAPLRTFPATPVRIQHLL